MSDEAVVIGFVSGIAALLGGSIGSRRNDTSGRSRTTLAVAVGSSRATSRVFGPNNVRRRNNGEHHCVWVNFHFAWALRQIKDPGTIFQLSDGPFPALVASTVGRKQPWRILRMRRMDDTNWIAHSTRSCHRHYKMNKYQMSMIPREKAPG